jgi:hypothetical protein
MLCPNPLRYQDTPAFDAECKDLADIVLVKD